MQEKKLHGEWVRVITLMKVVVMFTVFPMLLVVSSSKDLYITVFSVTEASFCAYDFLFMGYLGVIICFENIYVHGGRQI